MLAKIRPQVMAAIVGLVIISIMGICEGWDVLAGAAVGGIIALAKDLIGSDKEI